MSALFSFVTYDVRESARDRVARRRREKGRMSDYPTTGVSGLGLPRYVVAFLRHMEIHKDYLKWNIVEGSHKLTLTLTWNFRKDKVCYTLHPRTNAPGTKPPGTNRSKTKAPRDQ